ncbi:HupE/UreJ family protein [Ramlibacter ginsenosidimutans]|uniref:HupE/UreJ family protein n=1 Tax=Ramlibacter ginsenosidimutans TaxID=502333 RepID=A0A934TNU9_9BURK|nr:HupE/UreJ family protein [Ramlibacter ginsenosidimutans]MBK6004766.1 HupE/UreJ family protein [Ramlibacter ginsenosidimutans]
MLTHCIVAALLLVPAQASAHLATTGLGPVYDGILHLFLSLDDLLPVFALALLAGLNGPTAARWTVFALPAAWFAGGMAGFLGGPTSLPNAITSLWLPLLLLGLLVATDVKLGAYLVATLAAMLGLLHGNSNGADIASAGREASGVVGIIGAIFVVSSLVAAGVISLRVPWARIVVRVAGSWTAATGLLLLGWSLAGRA